MEELAILTMKNILEVSRDLAVGVERLGHFEMLSKGERFPIISFRQIKEKGYSLQQLSYKLRV
ncbi:MAG: hypothetical protein QM426_09450 [Euryarchaeota archaeon]|nr:hypothetical protein [Euryarchaeota archaeon]